MRPSLYCDVQGMTFATYRSKIWFKSFYSSSRILALIFRWISKKERTWENFGDISFWFFLSSLRLNQSNYISFSRWETKKDSIIVKILMWLILTFDKQIGWGFNLSGWCCNTACEFSWILFVGSGNQKNSVIAFQYHLK